MRHKGIKAQPGPTAKHSFTDVEHFLSEKAVEAERTLEHVRLKAFHRFPILFIALTFCGGVMTVYGFEHLIEEFTSAHPAVILVLGLGTLAFTGALHKRLSK